VGGNRFTYQTTLAGAWDGTIHCRVLGLVPNERFVYGWNGSHEGNLGYGVPLDTGHFHPCQGNGRHARSPGPFRLHPAAQRNRNMGDGWKQNFHDLVTIATEGEESDVGP
jgi:uncharacterized protein YndB with AHSA1/START domain